MAELSPLTIVGNSYRSIEAQKALSVKNKGTLVLLVPEPGNPHDPNAIACFITKPNTDPAAKDYAWIHAGYIPKETAAKLKPHWPEEDDVPQVVVRTLSESASARSKTRVVELADTAPEYPGVYVRNF